MSDALALGLVAALTTVATSGFAAWVATRVHKDVKVVAQKLDTITRPMAPVKGRKPGSTPARGAPTKRKPR